MAATTGWCRSCSKRGAHRCRRRALGRRPGDLGADRRYLRPRGANTQGPGSPDAARGRGGGGRRRGHCPAGQPRGHEPHRLLPRCQPGRSTRPSPMAKSEKRRKAGLTAPSRSIGGRAPKAWKGGGTRYHIRGRGQMDGGLSTPVSSSTTMPWAPTDATGRGCAIGRWR